MKQTAFPAERPTPALISASELADLLQVSTRTLWRLRSAGKLIRPVKIGGSTRWRLAEVQTRIAEGCHPKRRKRLLATPTFA
jgi:predicted DNA-binding transcriptional regulator AlpA